MSVADIEVAYLEIKWNDNKDVSFIDVSRTVRGVVGEDGQYQVSTTTFPGVNIYAGFKILEPILHTPYIKTNSAKEVELVPIKVPASDDVWWIVATGWDELGFRYLSELTRTVGVLTLVIQNKSVEVINDSLEFTVEELEYYLSDFKNSLWEIILNENSPIKSKIQKAGGVVSDDLFGYFEKFADAMHNIINKPHYFLSEIQSKRPKKSVRPVNKTFREMVNTPYAKQLTSRDFRENLNTSENRYLHYCLIRLNYILGAYGGMADTQNSIVRQRMEKKQKLLNNYQQRLQTGKKKVNKEVFLAEQNTLNNQYQELLSRYQGFSSLTPIYNQPIQNIPTNTFVENEIFIELGQKFNGDNFDYFLNTLRDRTKDGWRVSFVVIIFPSEINEFINKNSLSVRGLRLRLTGGFYVSNQLYNGKPIICVRCQHISRIDISIDGLSESQRLADRIRDYQVKQKLYENSDWIANLTSQERSELKKEMDIFQRKIELLNERAEYLKNMQHKIPNLRRVISRYIKFFQEQKVQVQTNSPSSMVFIQNKDYYSAKKCFRQIIAAQGVSDRVFDDLIVIDEMGLVNVANLYEKWCLLQIIKVLNEVYHFSLVGNWQEVLVDSVLKQRCDIEILLNNENTQQHILLSYEKTLPNGKRPDFVLDLYAKQYEFDEEQHTYFYTEQENSYRLVLDAKFKSGVNETYIKSIVRDLCANKDYVEDGKNPVFVLQPVGKIVQGTTSPLAWGRFCDYGQSHKVNHQSGHIFLCPSLKHGNSLNNLQRLLGMFFQQHMQILSNWANVGCIGCGNPLQITYSQTLASKPKWTLVCPHCHQISVKTHCYNCGDTLFKNGSIWTYHRTYSDQVYNIICPRCESFL